MKRRSKRFQAVEKLVDRGRLYEVDEAVALVKSLHTAKFEETVELAVRLDIDPKKVTQPVRGSVVLPHGTGRKVRILVLTQGENVEKAKAAGAEHVGNEDLIEKIKKGWMDFDTVIATPDVMKNLAPLGKILGPRGLMPSPKTGTVTFELDGIIAEMRKGRVDFKMDREGNVQIPVGKTSFEGQALAENIVAAIGALLAARPAAAKGAFLGRSAVALTMSPSIPLNTAKLAQSARAVQETQ